MIISLMEKLHLDLAEALTASQEIGNVGSWLHVWETDEYFWSAGAYRLHALPQTTPMTRELYFSLIYPDDRAAARECLNRAIQKPGDYLNVYRICVNGNLVWIEDRARSGVDEETGYTYIIGMMHDITAIKEEQLRIERHRFAFEVLTNYLAETTNTNDLQCIVLNASNTIRKVMDVALVGLFVQSPAELLRIFPPDTAHRQLYSSMADSDYAASETIRTGRRVSRSIEQYEHEQVRALLCNLNARMVLSIPIKNDGKTIAALSLTLRKERLTEYESSFCSTICGYLSAQLKNAMLYHRLETELNERIRTEERNSELQRSVEMEKLKSEFFANLSHEFKTPLNIILSTLELLRRREEKNPPASADGNMRFYRYLEQNAYRLLNLTTNLLDCTKYESGYLDACFARWDLRALLAELVQSVEGYALHKNLSLKFICTVPSSTMVVCDRDKIERIVLNLLSNAVKNTPPGGHIALRLCENEDAFLIAVSDTGVGIPQKDLPYIFDKFRVAGNGLIRQNEGTGLGLSIVQALVTLHGGTISVESEEGCGSTFRCTISKHLQENACGEQQSASSAKVNDSLIRMGFAEMEKASKP